jgi:hypothetical protein
MSNIEVHELVFCVVKKFSNIVGFYSCKFSKANPYIDPAYILLKQV